MIEPKRRPKRPKSVPERETPKIDTTFLLMWQYGAVAGIPVEKVRGDYFRHLTLKNLLQKIASGKIALPLLRLDDSERNGAKGVHIIDLAQWIDQRAEAARKECPATRRAAVTSLCGITLSTRGRYPSRPLYRR